MQTTTETKYSRLENRFDSEYYKPEYMEVESKLEKNKYATLLKNVVKKSNKTFDPTQNIIDYFNYIEIDGINLIDGNFSFTKLKNYEAPSRARKKIEYGDIFISTVRPNRNAVSLFLEKSNNYVCSTGFCVIKSERINPYFLFIFLKTKYSIYQLIRNTSAAMYPAVSEENVLNIKTINPPKPFQLHIEKLVKEAFSKRKLADQKYKQAKQLLKKELGLDKLKLKEKKTFEVKYSELFESGRFDVEFHNPKHNEIKSLLERGNQKGSFAIKKLIDISRIYKGIEIGSDAYTKEGILFLRVSNVSEKEIKIEPSSKFIRSYLYDQLKTKFKPEVGDILYTKDATIGVSTIVDKDFNKFIPSSGIVVIKPINVDSYYLTVVLNSLACKFQSEKQSIGAVIKHFNFENVKNLLIPIISKQKQENIAELIKQSFALRKKAKQLLQEAKEKMERMIENPLEISETQPEIIIPFPAPSKSVSPKPPVKIKYKEYQMLDASINKLVQQLGDGSIIKRFEKTPIPKSKTDVVCPHFLELKWATGCPYDCSWCYLKGTFRFLPYKAKPHIKDFNKIEKHTKTFLEYVQTPEVLNTGELADSLMLEGKNKSFVKFIVPLFENQSKHKVLFLTKSNKIKNLLLLNSHRQVIVSFSLNAIPVAQRWEKKAPSVEDRIKAAETLYKQGHEVRIRIDPMIPVENWEQLYTDLIDRIFNSFIPERITLGSLRGLQSTINGTSDKSWVKYLSERSNWGRKIDINLRLAMYKNIISYLREKYKYNKVALCKETLAIWDILNMDYKNIKCNCIW